MILGVVFSNDIDLAFYFRMTYFSIFAVVGNSNSAVPDAWQFFSFFLLTSS